MAFAMRENPGTFTSFEFTPGVPAPFGMALATFYVDTSSRGLAAVKRK